MISTYQLLHRRNNGTSSSCVSSVITQYFCQTLFLIPVGVPVGDQRRHRQSNDETYDQAKGRPLDKPSYYQSNDDGRHYGNISSAMHELESLLLI